MKVLVVTNMAPFVWGGAEELARELCRQLVVCGHQSELLRLPFQWEPAQRIPSQMLLVRSLELDNVDHVIALKFPAYLIRHPRKTLWVVHQYRQAYDLFESGITNISNDPEGGQLRDMIRNADNQAFAESRGIFVISPVVRDRMKRYNGVDSLVLRPPMIDRDLFVGGKPGDYVFAAGRVNDMKRQALLVEAVAMADPAVRLLIAGPPDSPADAKRIKALVERLDVEDRVQLDLRFLERETYAAYLNGAAAVAYAPFDEDSLGYVSVEAAEAGKPLITTSDSGGVLGLARDGETAWVSEPDATALALALSEVASAPHLAQERGDAARALWRAFNVEWDTVIEMLLR
jgi:glycosyltransferase involved in cell wall biosynthesis